MAAGTSSTVPNVPVSHRLPPESSACTVTGTYTAELSPAHLSQGSIKWCLSKVQTIVCELDTMAFSLNGNYYLRVTVANTDSIL